AAGKRGNFDMVSWKTNRTAPIRTRFDIATPTQPYSKAASDKPRRRSSGGSVERNDDGTYDADNANLTELRMALEQASRKDSPDNTRADAPPNQAAADFNETASYRTGQGVRDLRYRWGQGAQTAQHQQQPSINDIVDQSMQAYDPDQNDSDNQQ